MDEPVRVVKALAYITHGEDLLVLRHRDVPLNRVGVQVPAGTVRAGERVEDAVLREAVEETGVEGLRLVSLLGVVDYDVRPARAEVHERHVFHLLAPDVVEQEWVWHELHDGLRPPTAFVLSWLPVRLGHVLAAGMGVFLHRLPHAAQQPAP